ncbi:MAG: hypothetical protein J7L07_07390 [Candidatus Odinarchaeota archaeon]|nr:hypothetical protein [Candidatus Odinarchaeota archaeon]
MILQNERVIDTLLRQGFVFIVVNKNFLKKKRFRLYGKVIVHAKTLKPALFLDHNYNERNFIIAVLRRERIKIYFAHPMIEYDTLEEERNISLIKKHFKNATIVNPKKYRFKDMDSYLRIVSKCDVIVFKKFKEFITAGVGKEINFAFKRNIPVYEILGEEIVRVKELQNEILNRDETNYLYKIASKL